MYFTLLLFSWAPQPYGTAIVACFLIALFARLFLKRLQYLTWAKPTVPIGVVKDVRLDNEDIDVPIENYETAYWCIMCLFIVPYEAMVLFIDTKFDPSKGFCLTLQERQHSVIHKQYNTKALKLLEKTRNKASWIIINSALVFFNFATRLLKRFLPNVVYTIVALHENKFYYDQTIDELFEIFHDKKRGKVINKILLWHLYEELEHHMESVFLFNDHFGNQKFWRIPFTMPLYFLLLYIVHFFGIALALVNTFSGGALHKQQNPIIRIVSNIGLFLYDLIIVDVTVTFSAVLMLCNLSSRDEKLQADLQYYRSQFKKKYDYELAAKGDKDAAPILII